MLDMLLAYLASWENPNLARAVCSVVVPSVVRRIPRLSAPPSHTPVAISSGAVVLVGLVPPGGPSVLAEGPESAWQLVDGRLRQRIRVGSRA
jgi:hypothetical protein